MDTAEPTGRGVQHSQTAECERRLLEEARRDPDAFRQLYNLYLPRVYAYVGYRVGAAQDAEDITSEVFLRVVAELADFKWRHGNSLAAWIFRIAHNLVSNFHRDARRSSRTLPLEELPQIAANVLLPEDALLRKELFQRLHVLVDALPARRREVVSLRFFAGLRNQEIAAVLGIGERTVASTMTRALAELQAGLSERPAGLMTDADPRQDESGTAG